MTRRSEDPLPKLGERASKLRATLLADATVLTKHGLLDARVLKRLERRTGYVNLASDLLVLVHWFRANWSQLEGKTAFEVSETDEIEALATQIMREAGARRHPPERAARAIEERRRAFTVLVRAYKQVRAAVIYIRRNEDDADAIIPSLYNGRKRRPAKPSPPLALAPVSSTATVASGSEAAKP
jgi:hypothetical protein